MRTGLLLLLVACSLWAAEAQNGGQNGGQNERARSVWDDPVTFVTKGKDACAMHVTGQGDMTTLRVDCQGGAVERSYWCDYRGKPQTCRAYNNNPRHYFTQIMWDLRKLQNACSGPVVFKPQMCKRASDEARMVFVGASNDEGAAAAARPDQQQRPSRPTQSRPEATRPERPQQTPYRPTRPQPARPTKPDQAKSDQGRPLMPRPGSRNNNNNQRKPSTSKPSTPSPTQSTSKIQARKMAQDYCWRSMTGVCAYVIGLFRKS
ncbi:fibroblast growth factor binding protein 2a [Sardina pilchardus]|uniref:fibroblast growth factor binding protein 2a n=1 Tax=Sardina pilchardus TaxID=27697 RepID=UPI002E109E9D